MAAIYGHMDFDSLPLKEAIKKMEHAATNLKPVFRKAKEDLRSIYTEHFLTNGNGSWAPLDAEYGAWKARHYPGAPTLIRTDSLFQSIERFSVEQINDMSATFGTDAKVAEFHQYGTWKMPKREIIFEPPMFAKKLAEDVADHVERAN